MHAISFDHIHLRSPDPEGTARWFEETLGAEVVRTEGQDGQPPRIDLKLGGADIFIAPVPPGDATVGAPPRPPHQGLDHVGFAVPDLDAAAAALKAKGVEFTLEPKQARPGLRIAFIRGPQGISIELLQRG